MLKRAAGALYAFLSRLVRDRSGVSAVFLAVSLVPIVGAVGLAVDSSLGYLVKTRMTKALDAAGLAAGRVALDANAEDVAEQFFGANFGSSPDVTLVDFDFDLDETERFVTLVAKAEMPTYFMRIFGRTKMEVAARTVVERQTTGMELAMVLDNTGSMWGSSFTAMQKAARDMVKILYGDETEKENLWISLVPFTAVVNVGAAHTNWLLANDQAIETPGVFSPTTWKGCVMARANPRDGNDDPPSVQKFTSFLYKSTSRTEDNKWPPLVTSVADQNKGSSSDRNTARGPNLGCASPITPLTASRATIEAGLTAMGPVHRGGTASNLGLSWGWRTISPRWRGLWGNPDLPLDYADEADPDSLARNMLKVVVILTDGDNVFYDHDTGKNTPLSDFTAYGRLENLGVSSLKAGSDLLDTRMAATCSAMKVKGIQIYTIIFGSTPDKSTQALFTKCASFPSYYYYAPTNAALSSAFRSIGGQLANLMIVE